MKGITVSVIVPVYNVQSYLPKCLDNLFIQKLGNMEVVLVNDGSTDNSSAICDEYAQKHSDTIVINKENGGLSDARNAGTMVAQGDYIYYLDSDDWLAPDAIQTLLDYAEEKCCEIVQGGFFYAYEDHLLYNNTRKHSQVLSRGEAMLELVKNEYVKNFAWGKLYKADIVKKHLFPKGKFYEDAYWQHLIINECNHYGIVPTPLYYYRQRSSGISGEFSMRNLDLLKGYENRLSFTKEHYPDYTKPMVELLWNLSFSMVLMADRSKKDDIKKAYHQYWDDLNKEYGELFKDSLSSNLYYRIVQSYPKWIPIYNFVKRVVDRMVPFGNYKTIKIE